MGSKIQVTRAVAGDSISARCPFVAPQGLFVKKDPTDTTQYVKSDGTRGFVLEKDVLDSTTYDSVILSQDVFQTSLVSPVKQGLEVSARKIEEAIFEGDGILIKVSGTGAISSGTADDSELSTDDGQLYLRQSGDELVGWLRAQKTPDAEDTNTVAILVEFAG